MKLQSIKRWSLTCAIILLLSISVRAKAAVNVIVATELHNDAGIKLATDDLVGALTKASQDAKIIYLEKDRQLPDGDVIILRDPANANEPDAWQPPSEESYRIRPLSLEGRKAIVVEGKLPGMMYGPVQVGGVGSPGRTAMAN